MVVGLLRFLLVLALTLDPTSLPFAPRSTVQQNGETPAPWQAAGGPVAMVTQLAIDPDAPDFLILLVSQGAGRNTDRTQTPEGYLRQTWAPYISDDGGDTWQPASNDLAGVEPTFLTITQASPANVVWVGTAAQGLWRSDNSGRTWRPALMRGAGDQRGVALAQDARNRLHFLALDNSRYPDSYLFTSADGGYNWDRRLVQAFSGRPETYVTDLLADPFEANRLYAVTLGGLLTTTDAGFSWKSSNLPLPEGARAGSDTVLAVDPTQRGRLYLATNTINSDGSVQISIYLSLDSAGTWQLLPARFSPLAPVSSTGRAVAGPAGGARPLSLRLDPLNRGQLLLATNQGLWLSSDSGQTWKYPGETLTGVTVADLAPFPTKRGWWVAIGAGGIWRTANGGSRWQSITAGLPPASSLRSLAAIEGTTGSALLALNGGVMPIPGGLQPLWQSQDIGQTWLPAMRGLEGINLYRLQTDPSARRTVYGLASGGLARSTDAGRTWRYFPSPVSPGQLAFGSEAIFISSVAGLWRSTDQGETWTATSLATAVQAVANSQDGDVMAVVVGSAGKQLWRTSDDGETWTAIGPVPPGDAVQLLIHPQNSNILALSLRWGGLWRSGDGGLTWGRSDDGIPAGTQWQGPTPQQPAGPNLLTVFIDPRQPANWWAGRDGGGVYHSTDHGRTWGDATSDLGDNLVYSFAVLGDTLVAGTSNLGLIRLSSAPGPQVLPEAIDARIEILWPHDFAPVTSAQTANLSMRLYASRSLEVPPCAWMPGVELWMAQDAEPLRRQSVAAQRTVEGHPFPVWDVNDIDVSWANDPNHKLVFLARTAPGLAESFSSVWVHAADARTLLPQPPEPEGLTTSPPVAIDAILRVVWPHDEAGNSVPVEQANLANISAVLLARDTRLTLAPAHLPGRVWLVASLDNQVGRRLAAGERRTVAASGFNYTTYEFNNVDVSLARDPNHRWTYWLEVPDVDAASNIWVHGLDGRTRAPELLEPIAGCLP